MDERQRTFQEPYWVNDSKKSVIVKIVYDDDVIDTAHINREANNPDWQDLLNTFSLQDIDESTKKLDEELEEKKRMIEEGQKDAEQRREGDLIFNAKLAIFEIDEVKNSKNRTLKSKIRKSKSVIEAQAYASVLIMKEMGDE